MFPVEADLRAADTESERVHHEHPSPITGEDWVSLPRQFEVFSRRPVSSRFSRNACWSGLGLRGNPRPPANAPGTNRLCRSARAKGCVRRARWRNDVTTSTSSTSSIRNQPSVPSIFHGLPFSNHIRVATRAIVGTVTSTSRTPPAHRRGGPRPLPAVAGPGGGHQSEGSANTSGEDRPELQRDRSSTRWTTPIARPGIAPGTGNVIARRMPRSLIVLWAARRLRPTNAIYSRAGRRAVRLSAFTVVDEYPSRPSPGSASWRSSDLAKRPRKADCRRSGSPSAVSTPAAFPPLRPSSSPRSEPAPSAKARRARERSPVPPAHRARRTSTPWSTSSCKVG